MYFKTDNWRNPTILHIYQGMNLLERYGYSNQRFSLQVCYEGRMIFNRNILFSYKLVIHFRNLNIKCSGYLTSTSVSNHSKNVLWWQIDETKLIFVVYVVLLSFVLLYNLTYSKNIYADKICASYKRKNIQMYIGEIQRRKNGHSRVFFVPILLR